MSNLIDRDLLIKSIDYICSPGGIWAKPFEGYKEAFKEFVKGMPSAEPEIIRCKECKYRDADDFCTGRGYPCDLVPDDGFCDKGKER